VFGISRSKQRTSPPDDATGIADVVLQDQDGNDVRIGDTWADRPAVLVFLRHYG
jgi:hypothetical protein